MFKSSYTQHELGQIVKHTLPRKGWDFSQMDTEKQTVPWEYLDVVKLYLNRNDKVLDIGTGKAYLTLKIL